MLLNMHVKWLIDTNLFAGGEWSFQAFVWKAWKKDPNNPVNPVQGRFIKIESIP